MWARQRWKHVCEALRVVGLAQLVVATGMKRLLAATSMHEPGLLTFACGTEMCLPDLASSAVEFRGMARNSLGGAVSSSSVPNSTTHVF